MGALEPENDLETGGSRYSFRLSEDEIRNRNTRVLPLKIGAGVLLVVLLVGIYQVWRMPFGAVNKTGISALLVFLVVYLTRYLLSSPAGPVLEENRLVIDGRGIGVNNNYARWDQIEKAELKNRREGKYLQIDVTTMREGYTAPVRTTLFVWQIERYGDVDEIIAAINQRLQAPVVDSSS